MGLGLERCWPARNSVLLLGKGCFFFLQQQQQQQQQKKWKPCTIKKEVCVCVVGVLLQEMKRNIKKKRNFFLRKLFTCSSSDFRAFTFATIRERTSSNVTKSLPTKKKKKKPKTIIDQVQIFYLFSKCGI